MSYILESLRVMLGGAPRKPQPGDIPIEIKTIYKDKREEGLTKEDLLAAEEAHRGTGRHHRWLWRRWTTLVIVNILFVISYHFDVQLVEGALTASRVLGFHMADLNSALQVMLAYKHVVLNLVIGTSTVFVLWLLLGGRTFCSWVCPYHLVAEWAEHIHLWLAKKKIVKDHALNRRIRVVLYVLFALLALVSGYTVFETVSPTGILSRALIYGPGIALVWVGVLLLIEIFYSRRAWCRYMCPIGLTYGAVGLFSPVRVKYNVEACHHEGDCRKVCMVPHVLDVTIRGRALAMNTDIGSDCTRCGLCVDICPTHSLNFEVKGLSKFL